jgi:pimeloyl-ACP methyl ester carboxylesterase
LVPSFNNNNDNNNMARPTIVLVHGAWHSPEYFKPLSRVLQSHSYNVRSVALPSVVDEGMIPPTDPKDDIAAVRTVVQEELDGGHDVVVVPHSYGGIPTTSAILGLDPKSRKAAGQATSVVALGPISSFIIGAGKDLCTGQDAPPGEKLGIYGLKGPLNFIEPSFDAENIFYGDLPRQDAESWAAKLRPMLRTALWTLKSEYSAHKDIPVSYLVCTEDRALPEKTQRLIIKKIQDDGALVRVEEVKSSHSPFLSMPERTSDFIRRTAGEQIPV